MNRFPAKGAFYALNPARVHAAVGFWRTQLPTVTPYYAVKCNPDPTFLNMLFDAQLNFDCASERELIAIKALARGTLPARVVYANPCKSERDLAAAKQMGSPMTVVDSVEEVEKLAAVNYEGGALVRVAVDDSGSDMPFSSKFGAPRSAVEGIVAAAAGLKLPLHGFSFHAGSGSKSDKAIATAIAETASLMPLLWRNGNTGRIVDMGGGFLSDEGDFRMKALRIRGAMSVLAEQQLQFIAEPGRFFAANSFDFFVRVIGKKPAYRADGSQDGWRFTVDDSVYGQFSNILFDKARPKWVRVRDPCAPGRQIRTYVKGTLFGRTCDSLDCIARSDHMEDLEVGDWLWFPKMGAYTQATASEFNGFPMPDTVLIENGGHEMPAGVEEFPWQTPKAVRWPESLSVRGLLGAEEVR